MQEAANINQAFARIIAQYDITGISVGISDTKEGPLTWTAYVHWEGYTNSGHNCTSDHGDTAENALTATINRMKGERDLSISVPPLTISVLTSPERG